MYVQCQLCKSARICAPTTRLHDNTDPGGIKTFLFEFKLRFIKIYFRFTREFYLAITEPERGGVSYQFKIRGKVLEESISLYRKIIILNLCPGKE